MNSEDDKLNETKKELSKINDFVDKRTIDLEKDYEYARDKYTDLLNIGDDALQKMLTLAEQLESPRAMEVFAGLLKTNAEIVEKLIELQKKVSDTKIERSNGSNNGSGGMTQNNLFVGATEDLQRFLLEQRKIKDIEDAEDQ